MSNVHVGIIGCGNISSAYLNAISTMFSSVLEVKAVADIDLERAKAKAAEFNVPKGCSVDELLTDTEIDLVINLTIPKVHAQVAIQALEAGKHVYTEKPLAIDLEDGRKVLETAERKGLRVGGAPDTFLGGGIQTCRKLIDDGWIGEPIGATAFMMSHGPESWHPNPEFFYEKGGGPMFDMGPYYITALINLIGPVRRATGSARATFSERIVTSQQNFGKRVPVEIPTHVNGILDFANGAIATLITSFDVWSSQLPRIEIYGETGTMIVPDPNTFGGPVYLRRQGDREWKEVPLSHGFTDNSRGLGVADMAYAILRDRPHRASGQLTYHALEVMQTIHEASENGKHMELSGACPRPEAMPVGLSKETLYLLDV